MYCTGNLGALWDEIREALQNTIDKISSYVQDLKGSSGWSWFAALLGLVMWGAVLLIQITTLPEALVQRVLQISPRWMFYLINSALYDFVCNVRYCMALSGWGYAGIDDLKRQKTKDLLTIHPEVIGDRQVYPAAMAPRIDGFWLEHPVNLGATAELTPTVAGPYVAGQGPDNFLDGLPFDLANEARLIGLTKAPKLSNEIWTTGELRAIRSLNPHTAFFGNAADFSIRLINEEYPDAPFDLDGDRGYASLHWENYPPQTEYLP